MTVSDEHLESESKRILTGQSRGRFGGIAAERMAAHVLSVTEGASWPVRRAALEALVRRYKFGERDALKVVERPEGGGVGVYATKSGLKDARFQARPYVTALLSLEPLRMSCSCADFVRSSLGLCKHALAVLEDVEKRRAKVTQGTALPIRRGMLRWDFEHPATGDADRLERLHYSHAGRAKEPSSIAEGRLPARVRRDPGRRLAAIAELERGVQRGTIVAEPAVLTLLAEERARAERAVTLSAQASAATKALGTLHRKLYPYQREGVRRFFETGRLLLADDMGLGKTTQAIAACHGLYATKRVQRGLLIVPAALKAQWKREWDATTDVALTVLDGSPGERARIYEARKSGFLIMGYEQLLRDLTLVHIYDPDMVVLDEAQRIKNWATRSAAYVKSLSAEYRLVLTGTPLENRLDELASLMDFVDDLALEPKWRLSPLHSVHDADGSKGLRGVRHLETLRARLAPAMLRRVRKDVLSQLPPRTDTRVPVELTEPQRESHDDLNQPIAELVNRPAHRPLTQAEFLRLMQLLTRQRMICNGLAQVNFDSEWPRCERSAPTPQVLESLFMPKLAALRTLIEQVVIDQGRKAVIFSQWRNMLRLSAWAVSDLLAAAGMRAVFFTGAESAKLRERSIVELHDDPATTVMFLSDAGGVGLNLQRAASCCINLELPWNPAVLEQRIGRIYRLGQTQPIDVYDLVCEEGIEARIASLVANKRALFKSLFDGTTDEVRFDEHSSFLENVKKLMDPTPLPKLAQASEGVNDPLTPEEGPSEPERFASLPSAAEAPPVLAEAGPVLTSPSPLSVTRLEDGRLRIEAPPALAVPLADLFESLARSLRAP